MSSIFVWLIAIIYVEAATEIVVGSDLFLRFRMLVGKIPFLGKLLSCGYCLSVWVSFTVCWAVPGDIIKNLYDSPYAYVFDCFVKALVLHRLSNLFHEGVKRWLDRYPWVLSISKTEMIDKGEPIFEVNNDGTEDNNDVG